MVGMAALLGPRLIPVVFGSKYPDAGGPVAILAVGMGIYGFYTVMGSIWVGLGRPMIDTIATAAAMVATVATGLVLIPHTGLAGAAIAFTSGAAIRLVVISAFTIAMLPTTRARQRELIAEEGTALSLSRVQI